jgi:hypothetical protein
LNRILQIALVVMGFGGAAFSQTVGFNGFATQGGVVATTSGLKSSNYLQGIVPSAYITVYLTRTTTKATIYSDPLNTPLGNPFTADALSSTTPGQWLFFAAEGQGYDVVGSNSPSTPLPGYAQPTRLATDLMVGGGGGGGCVPGGATGTFLFDNGVGGCSENYIDFGATTANTLTLTSPGNLGIYAFSGVNSQIHMQVTGGEGTAIVATAPAVGGGVELRTDDGAAVIQATGGTGTPTINLDADFINIVHDNNGILIQGDASTVNGAIQFYEGSSDDSAVCPTLFSTTQVVQICAPSVPGISPPASYTMTLPSAQGAGALTNDGAGHLSWATAGLGVTSVNANTGALVIDFSAGAGSCTYSGGTTTCSITGSGSGGGSVTNFIASSGSWPSILVPSVATSTTTPTLSVTLANQTANLFFAGPASGSAPPTFRTITSADLPLIPIANGGTGTASPGLIQGSGILITGSWPNQTINATSGPGIPGGSSGQIQWNNSGSFAGLTVGGDCTLVTSGTITCTKSNGVAFGTAAFATLGNTGSQVPQLSSGLLSSTVIPAISLASSGPGGVAGNLPVTNLAGGSGASSATFWRGDGTWANPSGGASGSWSSLTNPTTNLSLTMPNSNQSLWTWGNSNGTADLWKLTDGASDGGTGIMFHVTTASGSTEVPVQFDVNGVGWRVNPATGAWQSVGATSHGMTIPAGTCVAGSSGVVVYCSDPTFGYAEVNENNTGLARICTSANGICSGAPGGSSSQLQYNNSGAFGGYTMSGDATLVPSTGIITVTKSNGVSFGTAAFVNTGTSGGTVPLLNTLDVFSGGVNFNKGGSSGFSPVYITGTLNTAAGYWPQVYIDQNTSNEPTWPAGGTVFGINEPSGFGVGKYFEDFVVNGTEVWVVDGGGDVSAIGTGYFGGVQILGGASVSVYRCTTAGTLPVGALTVNTANCGASTNTGLVVQ